jgi:uncharacterized membrane protein
MIMRKSISKTVILVAVASLVLAGCGGSSSSSTPPGNGTPPPGETPFVPPQIGGGDEPADPEVFTFPVAINNFNEIVGSAANAADETLRPAFWAVDNDGTAAVDPVLLGSLVENGFAAALGLNAEGVIVGMATDAAGNVRAVVWSDKDAAPTALQGFAGGTFAAAYGINDSGRIVGESQTGEGLFRAVRWQRAADGTVTGPFALPGVPPGWEAAAYAINANNDVAGEIISIEGISTAVVWQWTPAAGETPGSYVRRDLPTPDGSDNGVALALNNNGSVVGEGFDDGDTFEFVAIHWTLGDEIIMNSLKINDLESSAAAVNDAGRIVGWEELARGSEVPLATIWNPGPGFGGSVIYTTESQAFGINANNLVIGVRGTTGFVKKVE